MTAIVHADTDQTAVTPTGATFREGLSFEEWSEFGDRLATHDTSLRWAIGDWILYGTDHYGAKAVMLAAATGLAEQTIAHTLTVCRAIPPERRRPELTFTHHEEVKAQRPEVQDALLQQAIDEQLSCSVVRSLVQQMGEDRRSAVDSKKPDIHVIRLRIDGDVDDDSLTEGGVRVAEGLGLWLTAKGLDAKVQLDKVR